MHTVRDALFARALEKGLRQSTLYSYERLLSRLELLELEVDQVNAAICAEALWRIDNPNTRRSAAIAIRSVLGIAVKIPRGVPRRYVLPSEDELRLALMLGHHEARGLLMMYAGLRVGEACAITAQDCSGDRLRVDKQVIQLHRKGEKPILRIGPVKTMESDVVIPHWLSSVALSLQETVKPDSVRESLRRAGRKVGIQLNPHLLRHWYATTLLERGVPLALVSQQMRHSDIAVTLRTYQQYDAAQSIHQAFDS